MEIPKPLQELLDRHKPIFRSNGTSFKATFSHDGIQTLTVKQDGRNLSGTYEDDSVQIEFSASGNTDFIYTVKNERYAAPQVQLLEQSRTKTAAEILKSLRESTDPVYAKADLADAVKLIEEQIEYRALQSR